MNLLLASLILYFRSVNIDVLFFSTICFFGALSAVIATLSVSGTFDFLFLKVLLYNYFFFLASSAEFIARLLSHGVKTLLTAWFDSRRFFVALRVVFLCFRLFPARIIANHFFRVVLINHFRVSFIPTFSVRISLIVTVFVAF